MKVEVNGEPVELSAQATLMQLLDVLQQDLSGVAIAVNQTIVPQHDWDDYLLQDRDNIAIFRAIAGG
ncbi:sulfur carrier protein ThiS [Neiella sp. HB171785]|uniref:Sulfur carrier protein ThiS n=1 Tax=Neiella litorisoli TaxID=2771431 RepID=A0A8J6R4B4_9GAMM|nr:sulfur carrier protein ThiS [Neiella litorisoli]MBD1391360.1 sulfur carrier protein ThiS [Neiella litorisoli]